MKPVIIIGGGLAGLSAAVHLTVKKIPVLVLEASPKLGGRTYSLHLSGFSNAVDNGQHILTGAYPCTLEFLQIIGSMNELYFQNSLRVPFVSRGGKIHLLKAASRFYPANLIFALSNYSALSPLDRIRALSFLTKANMVSREKLSDMTAEELLDFAGQTENTRKKLWDILLVGIMNATPDKASARLFITALNKMFLKGNSNSKIILPDKPLSDIFAAPAEHYIENNGGTIFKSRMVADVKFDGNTITEIRTKENRLNDFSFVISAVQPFAFKRLFPDIEIPDFNYSSILNIHLQTERKFADEKFYGLLNSKLHWVFFNNSKISITVSSAENFRGLTKQSIYNFVYDELADYFPEFDKDKIIDRKIIFEKRATFIPDVKTEKSRELIPKRIGNLFISGDWTNTNLPATIESAVLSGKTAADIIAGKIENK